MRFTSCSNKSKMKTWPVHQICQVSLGIYGLSLGEGVVNFTVIKFKERVVSRQSVIAVVVPFRIFTSDSSV